MLRFAHTGSEAEGRDLLAPMLAAGEVLVDGVAAMPYADADSIHQDPTDPMPVWEKAALLRELPAEGVESILEAAGPESGAPLAIVELRLMGVALARQPRVPNAVAGREGAFSLSVVAPAPPPLLQAAHAVTAGVLDALQPWSPGTTLVNFAGHGADEALTRAWAPEVLERLRRAKAAVDPRNLFGGALAPAAVAAGAR